MRLAAALAAAARRAYSCVGGESVVMLEPLYVTLYRDMRDYPVLAATEFSALSAALVRGVFAYLRRPALAKPFQGVSHGTQVKGAIPSLRDFCFGREFCFCLPTLRWLICHMGAWLGCAQGFLVLNRQVKY